MEDRNTSILDDIARRQMRIDANWKKMDQECAKYWLSVIISLDTKEQRKEALEKFVERYEFTEKVAAQKLSRNAF
jgi:hypothetical protein